MADIRRAIDEFHIDLSIIEENGQEKLLFEEGMPSRHRTD
jgi:hypothetical protein